MSDLQIDLVFPDHIKQPGWLGRTKYVIPKPVVICEKAKQCLKDESAQWLYARCWKMAKIIALSGMIATGVNLLTMSQSHYPYLKRVAMAVAVILATYWVDELFVAIEHERRSSAKEKHREAVKSSKEAFQRLTYMAMSYTQDPTDTIYNLQKEAIRNAFKCVGIQRAEANDILSALDSKVLLKD